MDPRLGSTIILTFLLLLVSTSVGHDSDGTKVSRIVATTGCTARVQTEDKAYKWIDLTPLTDIPLVLNGTNEKVWNEERYTLTLCQQRDYTEYGQCLNQVFVYENTDKKTCSGLGNESTLEMEDYKLILHISSHIRIPTYIPLNCSSEEGRLVCVDPLGCYSKLPGQHSFLLNTKYACLGEEPDAEAILPPAPKSRDWLKLSPGSIVLIAAGCVLVTYLIVGVAHGTGKGEKGLDRLPNSDFWQELPLLVKDGIVFTFVCKLPVNRGYALIKEDKATPPPPAHV